MGLRAVDKIAERHRLTGVYGPLYRLFEVTDHKFNIAIELTAGNRLAFLAFAFFFLTYNYPQPVPRCG